MEFKVGDYVITTNRDWKEQGFNEPKRIYAIKNDYCNLGGKFDSCHYSHLKIADTFKLKIIEEMEIIHGFQNRISDNLIIRFDRVKAIICYN